MSLTHFHNEFGRDTSLGDAWRACGVEGIDLRNPPWHSYRPDGHLVMTVWRDHPDAGRWVDWRTGHVGLRVALRDAVGEAGESPTQFRKLRDYNAAVRAAAADASPIIVLVLNWRRDGNGHFVAEQRGASMPVEAWTAWIEAVRVAGDYPYSVVPI